MHLDRECGSPEPLQTGHRLSTSSIKPPRTHSQHHHHPPTPNTPKMEPDLPTFARDAAACGSDLYTLLEIDALASESDIRRAFRKKALTAHPDKTGDAYDPVYYRRLERTRDVLLDADARKLYDDGMRAVHEKRHRLSQMDARRRRLVEELEAAENAAKRAKQQKPQAEERDPEREAMAAKGRKIAEERRRLMREAEEREAERERERERAKREAEKKQAEAKTSQAPKEDTAAETEEDYDQRIAELEQRLRESQQRKAEKKAKKAKKAKDPSPPPPPPHDPPSPRAEADGLKQPSETTAEPVPPATIPLRPSAPAPVSPDAGKGRFASTMARLRAAQAEKDKRRREEEAAKVSAGPAEA